MSIEIKVPQLPESVADAIIAGIHKQVGDTVARDENVFDLETDKVVLEVPAPADGVITAINFEDGDTVTNGDVLGVMDEGKASADEKPVAEETSKDEVDESAKGESEADDIALSPAVRNLVEEHGLNPADINGTGKGGRLVKGDVLAYIESREETAAESSNTDSDKDKEEDKTPPAAAKTTAPVSAPSVPSLNLASRQEQRVPMTRLRTRIAERMLDSQANTATLTTFNEVNLTKVNVLRKKYRDTFEKEYGVRLGYMSFFVKAVVEALRKHPIVNSSVDDGDIIYHDYFDVGVAVSIEKGLVVPVLRDADGLSFGEIERSIGEYGQRARDGQLTIEEMTGGTFTISNGGVYGSMMSTPILNPPQSAILGMHSINERPTVVDGEVVVAPMMYLALSYDHRIIDGRDAVQFLSSIKESLEDPARLLLQL